MCVNNKKCSYYLRMVAALLLSKYIPVINWFDY